MKVLKPYEGKGYEEMKYSKYLLNSQGPLIRLVLTLIYIFYVQEIENRTDKRPLWSTLKILKHKSMPKVKVTSSQVLLSNEGPGHDESIIEISKYIY
jgi:hypothetical protein